MLTLPAGDGIGEEVLDLAVAGPMLGSGYVLDLPSERRGERY